MLFNKFSSKMDAIAISSLVFLSSPVVALSLELGNGFNGRLNAKIGYGVQLYSGDVKQILDHGENPKPIAHAINASIGFDVYKRINDIPLLNPFVGLEVGGNYNINSEFVKDYKFNRYLNVNVRFGNSFKINDKFSVNPYAIVGMNLGRYRFDTVRSYIESVETTESYVKQFSDLSPSEKALYYNAFNMYDWERDSLTSTLLDVDETYAIHHTTPEGVEWTYEVSRAIYDGNVSGGYVFKEGVKFNVYTNYNDIYVDRDRGNIVNISSDNFDDFKQAVKERISGNEGKIIEPLFIEHNGKFAYFDLVNVGADNVADFYVEWFNSSPFLNEEELIQSYNENVQSEGTRNVVKQSELSTRDSYDNFKVGFNVGVGIEGLYYFNNHVAGIIGLEYIYSQIKFDALKVQAHALELKFGVMLG